MEKMWKTKGGVHVALLMLVMIILFINVNPSRATSLVPKMSNNSATGSGCSSIHDCLITDHQSLEFLLGSEADTKPSFDINKSLNGGKPIADCGRGNNYKQCVPNPNDPKVDEHCYDKLYPTKNRGCV